MQGWVGFSRGLKDPSRRPDCNSGSVSRHAESGQVEAFTEKARLARRTATPISFEPTNPPAGPWFGSLVQVTLLQIQNHANLLKSFDFSFCL